MKLNTRFLFLACALGLMVGCAAATDKGAVDTSDIALLGGGSADGFGPFAGPIGFNDRVRDGLDRSNPYDIWDLEGGCDDAFIDLASREGGDTFLLLYRNDGGRWTFIDRNDDCTTGTLNSCLELSLDEGAQYRVVASSYPYMSSRRRPTFDYELEVFCRDQADPTGQTCGTRGAEACPEGFFCDWTETAMCGWADAPGSCQPVPDFCTLSLAFVCGCDGVTYNNVCFANRAGVSVLHPGACETPGQGAGETCGGIAALECADGLFCDMSGNLSCSIADAAGVCQYTVRPLICIDVYAPECGCDGVTYTNSCPRRIAGVALDHTGECEAPAPSPGEEGGICAGIAGFRCQAGLRCDMSGVESCSIADAAGVCVVDEPVICTANYLPVCGCDGVTYSNDCRRRAEGVPFNHDGAC